MLEPRSTDLDNPPRGGLLVRLRPMCERIRIPLPSSPHGARRSSRGPHRPPPQECVPLTGRIAEAPRAPTSRALSPCCRQDRGRSTTQSVSRSVEPIPRGRGGQAPATGCQPSPPHGKSESPARFENTIFRGVPFHVDCCTVRLNCNEGYWGMNLPFQCGNLYTDTNLSGSRTACEKGHEAMLKLCCQWSTLVFAYLICGLSDAWSPRSGERFSAPSSWLV